MRPVGLIADTVFPPLLREGVEQGQVEFWDGSNLEVPADGERGIGEEASKGTDQEPTYKTYKTKTVARKRLITSREVKNYGAQTGIAEDRLRKTRVNATVDELALIKEVDLATKLLDSTSYPTGYSQVLGAGDVWSSSGGDPLGVIETAISKIRNGTGSADDTGNVFANAAVMDMDTWSALQTHTDLLEFMKYTKGGKIGVADFITIFGLVPIIAKARYKASGVITPVWSDAMIVCYIKGIDGVGDLNAMDSDMTFGRTILSAQQTITNIPAQLKDHDWAYYVENQHAYTHEFIGINDVTNDQTTAGYLIDNAV
jgi:hypothetical protein